MSTATEEKLFNCAIRSALDADQLRERLDLALAACAEYREKLDAAQADSRRLDWLEKRGPWESWNRQEETPLVLLNPIRETIDAAMQQEVAP